MTLTWIVLAVAGWAIGLIFVLLLMQMASRQDRAARHAQKRIDPHCDVTITRAG